MQSKAIFIFILLGTCLFQVTSASPANQDVQRNIIDDLIQQAQKAIDKLTALILQIVQDAIKTISDLQNQVNELATKVIEQFKQKLQEVINKAKQDIAEIIKKAEQLGIDISECIQDSEEQFQQLFEKLVRDEISCVTNEVDEVIRIITESIKTITDIYEDVSGLPQKLSECRQSNSPLTCIKNVLVDVANKQIKLPIEIAKKIQEVTQFVAGLQTRLEVCAVSQIANAGLATASTVAKIAACAIDKGVS